MLGFPLLGFAGYLCSTRTILIRFLHVLPMRCSIIALNIPPSVGRSLFLWMVLEVYTPFGRTLLSRHARRVITEEQLHNQRISTQNVCTQNKCFLVLNQRLNVRHALLLFDRDAHSTNSPRGTVIHDNLQSCKPWSVLVSLVG
jgi:hypothetical protein